jgi:hypothetical protein
LAASAGGAKYKTRKLANPGETVNRVSSMLFSSEVDADACQDLYTTSMELTKSEVKNNFVLTKGTWAEMANKFDPLLPDDIYKQTLLTIRDCFCGGRSTGGNIKIPRTTSKVDQSQSLENIKKTLRTSGNIWKTMEEKISEKIPEAYQKNIFLTIYKILSHD